MLVGLLSLCDVHLLLNLLLLMEMECWCRTCSCTCTVKNLMLTLLQLTASKLCVARLEPVQPLVGNHIFILLIVFRPVILLVSIRIVLRVVARLVAQVA